MIIFNKIILFSVKGEKYILFYPKKISQEEDEIKMIEKLRKTKLPILIYWILEKS